MVDEAMKFTIIYDPNHSMGGKEDFRVHRQGCTGIKRHQSHPRYTLSGNSWTTEAETAAEAVAKEVRSFVDQDMDYRTEHFHICHCCGLAQPKAIKVRISNSRHLGELQIVFSMLEGQGLRPINETQTAITVLVQVAQAGH